MQVKQIDSSCHAIAQHYFFGKKILKNTSIKDILNFPSDVEKMQSDSTEYLTDTEFPILV